MKDEGEGVPPGPDDGAGAPSGGTGTAGTGSADRDTADPGAMGTDTGGEGTGRTDTGGTRTAGGAAGGTGAADRGAVDPGDSADTAPDSPDTAPDVPDTSAAAVGAARTTARRVLWGSAVAVACTAAMIAVTVPLQAMGDDGTAPPSAAGSASATTAAGGGKPAPAVVEKPGPAGERGSGRDPLTPDEAERARAFAVDDAFRAESADVHGRPGGEYLRTELSEQGPDADPGRTADVYFYNYRDGTTVKRVVDLGSGKVVSSSSAEDIQPPPSERETREALALLLKSTESRQLKANFRHATDRRLARPGQLNSTGMSYRALGSGAVAECARHRCVSLFTRVGGAGPWIDVTDVVVDLTDRTVSRVK